MAHKEAVAMKRIAAEYKKSSMKENSFYSIEWDDSNVFESVVTLLGPPDTPYVLCSIE
jgi:ubiquitin-protein ligase